MNANPSSHASLATARLHSVDALRGIAAMLVIFRHMPTEGAPRSGPVEAVVDFLGRVGFAGVDLFFVLSGFLISGLLFQEYDRLGKLDLPRFWLRRGLKIWPAYYVTFVGILALWLVRDLNVHRVDRISGYLWNSIPNILFVQNYVHCDPWPHTWSLAVEEHFYLLFPLVLLALTRLMGRPSAVAGGVQLGAAAFRPVLWLVPLVCVCVLAWRLGLARASAHWHLCYYPSHSRADGLAFGVLMGYIARYRPTWAIATARYWPAILLATCCALALPAYYGLSASHVTNTVGLTFLYLASGGLVLCAAVWPEFGRRSAWGFPVRLMATVGVYSYTVYLAHSALFMIPGFATAFRMVHTWQVDHWGDLVARWASRAAFAGLSIVVGVIISHVIERPVLRWRERRLPSSTALAKQKREPKPPPHVEYPVMGEPAATGEAV